MCISCFTLDSRNIPHFLIFVLCMISAPAAISLHVEKWKGWFLCWFPLPTRREVLWRAYHSLRSQKLFFWVYFFSFEFNCYINYKNKNKYRVYDICWFVLQEDQKKLIRLWKPLNTQWLGDNLRHAHDEWTKKL